MIAKTIARLDDWLRSNRPAIHAALRPGVSDTQIAAAERKLGRTLPDDVVALYRWKNGLDFDKADEAFYYNRDLMSLEHAVGSNEMLTELLDAGDFDQPGWWSRAWLPFLDNGGGDHHCIDLAGAFGGPPGQIIEWWHDDADRHVVSPSLDAWLDTFVHALETIEWHESNGNWEPADDKTLSALERARMPDYPVKHTASENLGLPA